ncbi:MAG: DUF11 domain-containing protein [Sphingomonas sp.]|nr:DUF11 domain-containing protein [Sphingomonas sp.]
MVAVLFWALALSCAFAAQAQTITNVAGARWSEGGRAAEAQSNGVTLTVSPSPVTIGTYQRSDNEGSPVDYTPSRCAGQQHAAANDPQPTLSVPLAHTTTVVAGTTLYFSLSAPAANLHPDAIDQVVAKVRTSRGDVETVTIFETAENSGVFLGALPTRAVPAVPVSGDCALTVGADDRVTVEILGTSGGVIASAEVTALVDPYGMVFDSEDGTPVNGAQVTLVDAATGAPARVFADDGVTAWPSSVIAGQPITDGAGNVYPMPAGGYRFPLAAFGNYRIVVTPPAPYSAPSSVTPDKLVGVTHADGTAIHISDGSYGKPFALSTAAPIRIDVPVDRPPVTVTLAKTVSRAAATPGDAVFYTITARNPDSHVKRQVTLTDTPSQWLSLRKDSIRVDGEPNAQAVQLSADGRSLAISLGDVAAGAVRTVTYAMSVRVDAPPGQAINRAEAVDARGNRTVTTAAIRIERETIAGRMTLIGRITDGGCAPDARHQGIAGVRVMLEDGSFAITDADGRYHFEGLVPGTHVVQAAGQTLPAGGHFVDCSRSTRSAGSATSRFVIGQGGGLAVEDFVAMVPERAAQAEEKRPASDRGAAGGDTDWLALGDGPDGFLFPTAEHNPRAPAVRVVIRHRRDQTVELAADGKPVDKVAFDGTRNAATHSVSIWRGIPLSGDVTHLIATIRNKDGSVASQATRDVYFSGTPARVELLPQRSHLIADGAARPVVAVRILDRFGRPVHDGLTGQFAVNAPYESAAALDAMQARALSGLDRARPTWTVHGDEGIALVELAPTMVSGPLHLDFSFVDRDVSRKQTLDAWVMPGEQKWTLVGLAEGSLGARTVADNMERGGSFDSDLGERARVAFYAKGRIQGRYLVTLAYDSAKQRDDQRLLGAIDPNAYYTVFADGSDRRFDAASRNKLYVRIEASSFYALYGDFVTGFDQTVLARYERTITGVKAEGQIGQVHVQGFATRTAQGHRRDEIQGGGITGPYRLSSRDIIANSETVTIEVRDRFRSEQIVERRSLARFTDYDIDWLAGTISFKEPVLSRDATLNPQFIVVNYEIDDARGGAINAGLRADWTTAGGKLRVGATAVSDTGAREGGERTNLAAVDLKAKIGADTEVRAEAAVSRAGEQTSSAWLVEVEHHDGKLDVLGYARSADRDFGVGQLAGAERGRRKLGVDARYNLTENWSVIGSGWYDHSLIDDASRQAVELATAYRTADTEARIGITSFRDHLTDGTSAGSTLLEAAATQRLLDSRLEVTLASSVALGKAESIDLPERHRLGLRYALMRDVKLVGSYEIAQGEAIDARTARVGFEVAPWAGARILTTMGEQDVAEYGKRSFAAFGLSQSLQVSRHLTIDATVDSSRTLGGFDAGRLVNPAHPAASGGTISENGTLAEDFTAVTLGGTWRGGRWTATARGELRDGELADRKGVTAGAIRQLGEGSMVGAGLSWTRADADDGQSSEVLDAAISAAHRPADSALALLGKLEFRSDSVTGAIAGEAGAAGRSAMTVTGDARSRRLMASLSGNWSPLGVDGFDTVQRTEIGFFLGARHNFDVYEGNAIDATSLLGGLDVRLGLGERFEIGGAATVRHNLTDGLTSFALGPQIGFNPADDVLVTLGYNVSGFRDRDFAAARHTDAGFFAAMRVKFDTDTLATLGVGQ